MIAPNDFSKPLRSGSKRLMALAVVFMLLAGPLGACEPMDEVPMCESDELLDPADLSPAEREYVTDTTPQLSWTYPDDICVPEYFEIAVWEGTDHVAEREVLRATTHSHIYSWPVDRPLEPGKTYEWILYAVSGTTYSGDPFRGGSAGVTFLVGLLCGSSVSMLPPVLLSPPDGSTIDRVEGFSLQWDNPNPCLLNGNYVLEVSPRSDFSSGVMTDTRSYGAMMGGWLYARYGYVLDNCTRYFWRVRADRTSPAESQYSETWSFSIHVPGTFCPIEPFHPTLPTAILNQHANCRSGPGMDYPALDILPQGTSVLVNGRNQQQTWWQVVSPNLNLNCWLSGNVLDLSWDMGNVPVIQVAPPPTPVPSDTPAPTCFCCQFKKMPDCVAQNNKGCIWDTGMEICTGP